MRYVLYYFFILVETCCNSIISFYKIFYWTIKYPDLKISFKSEISKGATIKVIKGAKVSIGKIFLGKGAVIFAETGSNIVIRDNVFIGPYTVIVARKAIVVEENVHVAEFVTIRDQNHLPKLNGFSSASIFIGKNTWIGNKVTITQGVLITDNCVVGAHALVNKSVLQPSLVGGVPAKVIKLINE